MSFYWAPGSKGVLYLPNPGNLISQLSFKVLPYIHSVFGSKKCKLAAIHFGRLAASYILSLVFLAKHTIHKKQMVGRGSVN